MKRQIVRPKPGCVVVDPYGRNVPDDGAIILWSSYWDRRLRDGVITVHEVEAEAEASAVPEKADRKPAQKARKKTKNDTEGTDK